MNGKKIYMYSQLTRFYSLEETEFSALEHQAPITNANLVPVLPLTNGVCLCVLCSCEIWTSYFSFSSMGIVMTDSFQLLYELK